MLQMTQEASKLALSRGSFYAECLIVIYTLYNRFNFKFCTCLQQENHKILYVA